MLRLQWILLIIALFHVALTMGSSIEWHRRGVQHEKYCEEDEKKKIKPTKTATTTTTRYPSPTVVSKPNSCEHTCNDTPCSHLCNGKPCSQNCTIPPSQFEPQVVAAAVVLMIIGVYLMAAGFAFFSITMVAVGLVLGSAVTWICLHSVEPKSGYAAASMFYLGCCIGGGLFLAAAFFFCWKVAMYILCGMAGYMISIYVWTWREDFMIPNLLVRNVIGLSLGFLFILGFVLIEFVTVILSTSFIGAYVFIVGLDLFIESGLVIGLRNILDFDKHVQKNNMYIDASSPHPKDPRFLYFTKYHLNTKVYGMMCAVFGLWIVSMTWQRYYNRGNRFGLRLIENANNTLKIK